MNEDEMLRKLKNSAENEEMLRKNKDSADDEMLRKLTDSAEDTEIPSGLEPENIRKNLEDNKEKIKKKSEEAKIYKFAKIASLVTAAAVVAFLIPMAVIISGNLKKNNTGAAAGAAGNVCETAAYHPSKRVRTPAQLPAGSFCTASARRWRAG